MMLVVPHFVPKPYLYSLLLSSSLYFSLLLSIADLTFLQLLLLACSRRALPRAQGPGQKNGHSFPSIKQASRSHAARTLDLHTIRDTITALLSLLSSLPGPRAQGPGSRVQGLGSRVQGPGSRIQGPGSKIQVLGSRGQGPGRVATQKPHHKESRNRGTKGPAGCA